ncbi:metallophosphoesterase [Desulfopila inferna]|uniref:metallophosphoesterase n=1 Tax=Desulfopila inferna TaxID=468528 RepID=UPI001966688E|nr:metallophosphoesterase [Desulfopila inferna]MBM9604592.1 metallophosphoesterase [Desulfopila inferna]
MSNILKKLLQPIDQTQKIRGVLVPVGLEFLQLIVTGPPGAGKTYYINQIGGWPNEGYLDLTVKKWWKNQSLIYRPREVHLGLPFKGVAEALTVFDKEWLEASPPFILECDRIRIPPAGDSFLTTDWKHRYVFEFIIPDPRTVYERRKERHKEGYFPVDDDLSLQMVINQAEVYREVALYLHRAKMQVYVREDINSPPMRIVEKGEAGIPSWLLPKNERAGVIAIQGSWKNLFLKRKAINWLNVSRAPQEITSPSRIAHDGKTFELRLGKQLLHFHPEVPLGVKKKHIKKNWLIFSPLSCCIKNILGFARLCVGDSVIIGRENTLYTDLFDLDNTVAQRHIQVTNRNGDLILTPLDPDAKVSIMRSDEQDNREKVETYRHEALLSIKQVYGGPVKILGKYKAIRLLNDVTRIIANDTYALKNRNNKAGGIIVLPDFLTPIIVGDLHAQVDNLLKILSENYLIECLSANTACLIILGDAVHSEIVNEMDDFDSSILMMDLILTLKKSFPDNFFYLRGNHDSFAPELSKNGIPQGALMQKRLTELRGPDYAQAMDNLYHTLPYIVKNSTFVSCHAAPPISKASLEQLINIDEYPQIIKEITTSRVQRQHYLNGYKKKHVKRFRKNLGLPKGSPVIVGHTPLDPFGSFWRDVSNIKGHHIIYSGHQEGAMALLIEKNRIIPLAFPAEPLCKLIDKIQ